MVAFDVPDGPVGPYEVGDSLAMLKKLPGVTQVALYETRDGSPQYLLDVEVSSEHAADLEASLRRLTTENSYYLSHLTSRRFTKIA
jgi:hypothetical protein